MYRWCVNQMSMKKYILLLAVMGWLTGSLRAQDPQYTQYYAQPLFLNPAFAGTAPMHRLTLANRIQWPNLPRMFNTTALGYDYNMPGLNSGFGFLYVHDRAGSSNLVANNFSGLYSYKIQLKNGWVISPGVQFGYVVRNLDYSRLLFEDQIGFGHSGQTPGTTDPMVNHMEKLSYFDFGTGLLLHNKFSWLGGALHHLNEPNQSVLGGAEDKLATKYSLHGGFRFQLYNGLQKRERVSSLAPSFLYKKQGVFQQLDVSLHLLHEPLIAGLGYRGMLLNDAYGYHKQDAFSMMFGFRFPALEVGYSYDFTISTLEPSSGGAHELTLGFSFNTRESRRVKRKDKFIPCPAFLM